MLIFCPYCGSRLPRPINHGITSCVCCKRVFDSSAANKLLSAAWFVRNQNVDCIEYLSEYYQITHEQAAFVIEHVFDKCLGHEDFVKIVKQNLLT